MNKPCIDCNHVNVYNLINPRIKIFQEHYDDYNLKSDIMSTINYYAQIATIPCAVMILDLQN